MWYLEIVVLVLLCYYVIKNLCSSNSLLIIKQLNKWHIKDNRKYTVITDKLEEIDNRIQTLEEYHKEEKKK